MNFRTSSQPTAGRPPTPGNARGGGGAARGPPFFRRPWGERGELFVFDRQNWCDVERGG